MAPASLQDPSWRALITAALHRNRSDPTVRYLQLATVDPTGHPRNRTVVFRGFLPGSDYLQFAVDARSEKLAQIQSCPLAQVCWYFAKTREQFRIAGTLHPIPAGDHPHHAARLQLWHQMSDPGKLLWHWPNPKQPQADPSAYISELPTSDPPDTYVLLLLDPREVDHLQLKGDTTYPQARSLYQQEGAQWIRIPVNP